MTIARLQLPDSISNEDLSPIVMSYVDAGGSLHDLPAVIGISQARLREYAEWVASKTWARFPDRRYPILIPETTRHSCISFWLALNLRLDDDDELLSGDSHFDHCFFGHTEPTYEPLAGRNGLTSTELALGTKGVRDMGQVIADHGVQPYDGSAWVANHYRAIADIATHELTGPAYEDVLPACQIADWLWSERDCEILVEDYLKPLRRLPWRPRRREALEAWLPTVVYDAPYD